MENIATDEVTLSDFIPCILLGWCCIENHPLAILHYTYIDIYAKDGCWAIRRHMIRYDEMASRNL